MPEVALSDSFMDSLRHLDRADAKRAVAFVDKLVREQAAPSLRPEIVHDAADRSIRSLKVTHDLRAIAHIERDRVVLLFVARHDRAYAWARDRCMECHQDSGDLRFVRGEEGDMSLALHDCRDSRDLCRILDSYGIAHEIELTS